MEYLYHGSNTTGLTSISPKEAGHKDSYVYAVTEPAFAAIFINRPGGSLLQDWDIDKKTKIPYLVEKKEGVIDKNYKNITGSIYVLDKKGFFQTSKLWREEWVNNTVVPVVQEIKIPDIKDYLLKLQEKNKLEIVYYKDRLSKFPDIDKNIIKDAQGIIDKYGDSGIKHIRQYRPDILSKLDIK